MGKSLCHRSLKLFTIIHSGQYLWNLNSKKCSSCKKSTTFTCFLYEKLIIMNSQYLDNELFKIEINEFCNYIMYVF